MDDVTIQDVFERFLPEYAENKYLGTKRSLNELLLC